MRQLENIYSTLFDYYGDLEWWPAKTAYEVIVGAILTQNTAWTNVEKAIANLGDKLSPEIIEGMALAELTRLIRPAGFYNAKAGYLKAVTTWFKRYHYDEDLVKKESMSNLRRELLAVKGVGQETADAILLYAFRFPSFVVDAYTHRLCRRYPLDVGKSYKDVKRYFEGNLPHQRDLYHHFHALIVIHAKEHCKKKPICEGCPLAENCRRLNI